MRALVLAALLVVTSSLQAGAQLVFADGFESGDTCAWSAAIPRCGFCADSDTVALWRFDEVSGQTLQDSSGHGRHLTLGPTTSAESADPLRVSGRFGGGLFFTSALSQYANGTGSNTFPSNQLTAELWVRPIGGDGSGGTAQIFTAGFVNCAMTTKTLSNSVWVGIGNGSAWGSMTVSAGSVDLDDGGWHYLAMTYDGVTLALYVDGLLAGSTPVATALASPSDYKVGGRPQNTFLDGWMDEVRLSDVARSSDQIWYAWAGGIACP